MDHLLWEAHTPSTCLHPHLVSLLPFLYPWQLTSWNWWAKRQATVERGVSSQNICIWWCRVPSLATSLGMWPSYKLIWCPDQGRTPDAWIPHTGGKKKWKCWLFSCVQLFATPWTVAHQAPLCMGFPRQEYWTGLPFPSLGDLSDPGIESVSPALAGRFFYHWVTRKAPIFSYCSLNTLGFFSTSFCSNAWRIVLLF